MEAIREIRMLKDNILTLELPESFSGTQVEIVVLCIRPNDAIDIKAKPSTKKRRTPSPLLTGTRIIGNIMSSAVADTEWEALS
ncbi:MAG: hypothetical protein NTV00_01230 [Methylococcales bacterium]|nr:hypothetical protein [Methylococcales bacterium]